MITGNLIHMMLETAETYFVAAPYACQVADVLVVSQGATMADDTVTVSKGVGGTAIGATVFTTNTAGELATYTRETVVQDIAKDGIIQILTGTFAGGQKVHVTLVLDPYKIQS